MRKAGTAILTTLLLVGTTMAALVTEPGHAPYYQSYDEGMKAAAEKEQPIALKFYTDW